MLDYAANAVAYWPVEEIRSRFEARCKDEGVDSEAVIAELLAGKKETDFWKLVKTNLQAGRIRMVFVADLIPAELRRVVEFLNEQTDPAEVLAIEVKQYVGQGQKTLVPRVIGSTEAAQQKKGTTTPRYSISEEEYLADLSKTRPEDEARVVRKLIDWTTGAGWKPDFSMGVRGVDLRPGSRGRWGERIIPSRCRTTPSTSRWFICAGTHHSTTRPTASRCSSASRTSPASGSPRSEWRAIPRSP